MERARFDRLARELASRRSLLAGLAAGLVVRPGTARAACPPDQVNRRGVGCVCRTTGRPPGPSGCPCPRGYGRCDGGACVRLVDGVCTLSFGVGTHSWTPPAGIAAATFDARGAAGGAGEHGSAGEPGLGGRVVATLAVDPDEVFDLAVGGAGGAVSGGVSGSGGANGGGAGGSGILAGGGGGGATSVSSSGMLWIVAGGGGGSGGGLHSGTGGGGGPTGQTGGDGAGAGGGQGGTATGGGAGGNPNGNPGQFGAGGAGGGSSYGGGGGAGGTSGGGGGGGSSYADPSATSGSMATGFQPSDGRVIITFAPDQP